MQTIVYRYNSAEVAIKTRKFRGKTEEPVEFQVNPLFLLHTPEEAYKRYLETV